MSMEDSKNSVKNGWSEYAHTILNKLEELHADNKETKKAIDEIKLAIVKLEINKEEVVSLKEWKNQVADVWSPSHMATAQKEIYAQKAKWAVGYGVFIAAQVIWALILFFKDKIIK